MSLRSFCTLVLDGYLALPDTPNRSSRYDRSLAESWFHRQIPLSQIQAAFALALLRRFLRNSTNPPLQPIRSLHYFVPVLEEIFQLDSRYLEYCRQMLLSRLFPPDVITKNQAEEERGKEIENRGRNLEKEERKRKGEKESENIGVTSWEESRAAEELAARRREWMIKREAV
jgi:hypothetical protein